MTTTIRSGPSSEMKYMQQEEVEVARGLTFTFLNFFEPPDIPESDGDDDYMVEDGDRLDKLAQDYYNDELLFWVIAVRNNMDLPDAELNAGMKIVIPDPVVVRSRVK